MERYSISAPSHHPAGCLLDLESRFSAWYGYEAASYQGLVKDGGYMIPMGTWVGVPMGMGMGPYLVTHQKPLPMSTHDPYDILVGLGCSRVKIL